MSATHHLTLTQFAGTLKKLNAQMPKAVHGALVEGAHRIVAQVQEEIATTVPHQPVNTGAMAARYRAKRTQNGAVVYNDTPQAAWIERGRRPGPVGAEGIRALALWVKRKQLYMDALSEILTQDRERVRLAKAAGQKRKAKAKGDAVSEACERVAHAIAKTIAETGYAPRWVLKRAIEATKQEVIQYIKVALQKLGEVT